MNLETDIAQRVLHSRDVARLDPLPFLSSLDIASGQPAALAEMWQHVVDGLNEQIALLDEEWTIFVVNQSWARTAELYGHFALVPGADYLQFCRTMARGGLEIAREVVAGIERIEAGKCNSFQMVYRASQPEVGHDHQLAINRFEVGGRKFASIIRYDVSRLLELRRLRVDFSSSVIRSQAEERQRMGREIHDSTMQLMVCLNLKIGQLRQTCETDACASILQEMEELLAEAQQEIRSIAYLAHPPLLGKMSLAEALQALVQGFGRRTGIDVEFETIDEPHVCCPAAEGAAYRIVQEALSNVHRHAKAKHATVRLARTKAMTHIIIADDGVGMPDVIHSGVGLGGMRSRLAELGGRLSIRPRTPGTILIATLPTE